MLSPWSREFWLKPWWSYGPGVTDGFAVVYHSFNLFEGAAWCLLAALVLRRFAKYRRSRLEPVYAFTFAAFGASDFREAYCLQSWLIAAKFVNLVVLLRLRSHLIKRHYPQSRTY